MLISEFQTHTGIYPNWALWKAINRAYNESELDQQKFCADYLANVDGLAQRIQRECDMETARAESNLRRKLFDAQDMTNQMENQLKTLQAQLDRELDWHPAGDLGTNMSESDYALLADDEVPMTELDAIRRVHRECGFDMAKIRIVMSVQTFEVNKHHKIRVKDTYSRQPVWSASDWNYIRFNVAGLQWEIVNGELMPYCD